MPFVASRTTNYHKVNPKNKHFLNLLFVLLTLLAFHIVSRIDGIEFGKIDYTTTITDIFVVTNPLLWVYISIISVVLITNYLHKNLLEKFWFTYLLWFILRVSPTLAYVPMGWKCAEEQAFFTEALIKGVETRNSAWPGAYILQISYQYICGIGNLLLVNIMLTIIFNFFTFILLYLIGRLIFDKHGYLLPMLFSLNPVYEYNYFADHFYAFILSLLIYVLIILMMRNKSKVTYIVTIFYITAMVVSNPITSYIILSSITLSSIMLACNSKLIFGKRKNLRHIYLITYESLKYLSVITLISLVIYYFYNTKVTKLVSNYLESILMVFNLKESSTIITVTPMHHKNLFCIILLIYRYVYISILGCGVVLFLINKIKNINSMISYKNDYKKVFLDIILYSVIAVSLIYITNNIIGMSTITAIRCLLYGTLFSSILASSSLLMPRTKLSRFLVCILLVTLPLAYAWTYYPSAFFRLEHPQMFHAVNMLVHNKQNNIIIVTDIYTCNYVGYVEPSLKCNELLSRCTVYGLSAPYVLKLLPERSVVIITEIQYHQSYVNHGTIKSIFTIHKSLLYSASLIYCNNIVQSFYFVYL